MSSVHKTTSKETPHFLEGGIGELEPPPGTSRLASTRLEPELLRAVAPRSTALAVPPRPKDLTRE